MGFKSRGSFNIPMCLPTCQCILCKRLKQDEKKKKTTKRQIPEKEKVERNFSVKFKNQKKMDDVYSLGNRLSESSLEAIKNI